MTPEMEKILKSDNYIGLARAGDRRLLSRLMKTIRKDARLAEEEKGSVLTYAQTNERLALVFDIIILRYEMEIGRTEKGIIKAVHTKGNVVEALLEATHVEQRHLFEDIMEEIYPQKDEKRFEEFLLAHKLWIAKYEESRQKKKNKVKQKTPAKQKTFVERKTFIEHILHFKTVREEKSIP